MGKITEDSNEACSSSSSTANKVMKKQPKRGIIYLSSIPAGMNVNSLREYLGEYGTIGRVYLQADEEKPKGKPTEKQKKKSLNRKYSEGWVEFEKKSIAKKVAQSLNNTQVSNRKKSKYFDVLWHMKYLHRFKWVHLNERLAYEKAARRQKLRTEIELAKKKTNFFTLNLDKAKKKKPLVNKEFAEPLPPNTEEMDEDTTKEEVDRSTFLTDLFA